MEFLWIYSVSKDFEVNTPQFSSEIHLHMNNHWKDFPEKSSTDMTSKNQRFSSAYAKKLWNNFPMTATFRCRSSRLNISGEHNGMSDQNKQIICTY